MRSLERGNLQSATLQVNGKDEKIFLAANPNFKSLNAFDSNMNKIKLSDVLQKQEQSNKQEDKQTVSEKKSLKNDNNIDNTKQTPAQKKVKRQKVT